MAPKMPLLRALRIAQSEYGRNPPAELEILLALQEIYDETSRKAKAAKMGKAADRLIKSGIIERDRSPLPYALVPKPSHPVLVLELPFAATGRPAGGRAALAFQSPATRLTEGTVKVAVPIAQNATRATWAELWPTDQIELATDKYEHPLVWPPRLSDESEPPEAPRDLVVYIPGQSDTFETAVAAAGRLQAALGPDRQVVLADWPGRNQLHGLVHDRAAEQAGAAHLKDVFTGILAAGPSTRLDIVANGRAGQILHSALGTLPAESGERMSARLKSVSLIVPDIDKRAMRGWAERSTESEAILRVYSDSNALPWQVASELYSTKLFGLAPQQFVEMGSTETLVVAAPGTRSPATPNINLSRILDDLGAALRTGHPPADRCGTKRVGPDLELWSLDPSGCPATKD